MATSDIRTSTAMCDLSSGNSEDALDTDAYLEALIRKQNIPRTKDYAPEFVTNSNYNRYGRVHDNNKASLDLDIATQIQTFHPNNDKKGKKKKKGKKGQKAQHQATIDAQSEGTFGPK